MKRFTDVTVPCGESGARPCQCGGTTQNSYQELLGAAGPKLLLFADGFETDDAVAQMKIAYAQAREKGALRRQNHCATHAHEAP